MRNTKTQSKLKKSTDLLEGMDDTVQVKMHLPKGSKKNMAFYQQIENYGSLGKEVKLSPKSCIAVNAPGFKVEYFTPTVSVMIGIGNDHTAELIMTMDAWEALKAGKPLQVDTAKEFKKKFL